MEWLKDLWDSLLDADHRGRLFGVITLLVGAVWGAYVHFSKKKGSSPTQVTAHGGGVAAGGNITVGKELKTAGRDINIGITLEEHDKSLKRRELEIREEIKEETKEDREKDQERIETLERQLSAIDLKLSNPEQDLEHRKKLLAGTEQALERQPGLVPEELEQARTAMNKGNTDKTEELFEKALDTEEKSIERAAEASYQLGLLAKDRVDYEKAWNYLARAAELAPNNTLYLNEAGLMAITLGRYATAIE